ncbi:hypothetical protein EPO66_01950 [bacterium]|nr:MAG: hypothetical protein EPO66_01950 [bacterium]
MRILSILLIVSCFLGGCATITTREGISTYTLNGATYISLTSFCDLKGIKWDYDTFTRTIVLTKGAHKVSLRAGDKMALVDGRSKYLANPVDIYQGTMVIPYSFKEILSGVFSENGSYVYRRQSASRRKIRKIVVDAGHGGHDVGAKGKMGLREKIINLDIAKRLAQLLKEEGIDIVFTRSSDRFITLPGRVEITNNCGADLFVSIHNNAHRSRSVHGFEIYYVSPTVSDYDRAVYAAGHAKMNIPSNCFAENSRELKEIIWDMTYTYSRAESIALSRAICRKIDNETNAKILGVKNARFYVLRGAKIPAVLVEVGYLTNLDEESYLKDGSYRQKMAQAIKDGIDSYINEVNLADAAR